MVFGRDDMATAGREVSHRLGVERLYGRHMQHAGGDAKLLQRGRRIQRPLGHEAGRDDADIPAFPKPPRLADLEAIAGLEHHRHASAQQPHVDRTLVLGDRRCRRLDLGRIARVDDGQAGDHAHQRQVLDRLMRAAIAGRETRQAGDDLDVEAGVGERDGDEIIGAPRREHAIGGGERAAGIDGGGDQRRQDADDKGGAEQGALQQASDVARDRKRDQQIDAEAGGQQQVGDPEIHRQADQQSDQRGYDHLRARILQPK